MDLLNLIVAKFVGVRKIEAKTLGGNIGAGLLDMIAKNLAKSGVEKMSGGVVFDHDFGMIG